MLGRVSSLSKWLAFYNSTPPSSRSTFFFPLPNLQRCSPVAGAYFCVYIFGDSLSQNGKIFSPHGDALPEVVSVPIVLVGRVSVYKPYSWSRRLERTLLSKEPRVNRSPLLSRSSPCPGNKRCVLTRIRIVRPPLRRHSAISFFES